MPHKNIDQTIDNRAKDAAKRSDFNSLKLYLELYYDANNKSYPLSLNELDKNFNVVPFVNYKYSTSPQRDFYHLGILLSNTKDLGNKSVLSMDSDFNSAEIGWENGFDGNDPVYDFKSN